MTESEWLACNDPFRMLQWVARGRGQQTPGKDISDRKLRLFACACLRQVWRLLTSAQQSMVAFVEEEPLTPTPGLHAVYMSQETITEYARTGNQARCVRLACNWLTGNDSLEVAEQSPAYLQKIVPFPTQADLLREIVGNPYRPATICHDDWMDPKTKVIADWKLADRPVVLLSTFTWRNGTVPKMARVIYDDRDWELMPRLADALEDAGCYDASILSHCRKKKQLPEDAHHVRGCWVLDFLTGNQ